jgi:hypothetical protein
MAERKTPNPPGGAGPDKYHVLLRAKDDQAVGSLLRDHALDIGLMRRDRETKAVELTLFLTEREIDALRGAGFELDVRANLSEVGRARQKEVGKGDRFAGGKIPPTGLGKKTRKGA